LIFVQKLPIKVVKRVICILFLRLRQILRWWELPSPSSCAAQGVFFAPSANIPWGITLAEVQNQICQPQQIEPPLGQLQYYAEEVSF
jgi:hypothetical protein